MLKETQDGVSNKGFSLVSGYVVNEGAGNAQVDDFWVAPGTDVLKCNIDGTFHSGSAVGGVGIIWINALDLKGANVDCVNSPVLLDILELLNFNEGFYVVFSRRQDNQVADWSGSNIGDRSSNSCFSARCAVGCACLREGVG
ncbi:uncharacterized protein G2W53_033083 [Senna tora]|uniref:Uncharacterized protein n=1 Tax=Senna tora TaxID=362788 RepID=A0A834W7K2_9FABA|nr:uncharacterized protein G2W53_033083 [Senna tora]